MKQWIYYIILLFSILNAYAQELDLENIAKDRKFRVSGGVNADAMYFHTSSEQNPNPFTYMLTGTLNFSFMTFSMPLSYSITNQGDAFTYKVPFDFNRLSIAPKYKWVKLYIGDHSLSYSPYTLGGHPFRGGGIELTPPGLFKFYAMGGQLLKAVEADSTTGQIPVYCRWGGGGKIRFEQEKYKIETIGFYAKDEASSLKNPTTLLPKSNIVTSIKFEAQLITNLSWEIEYAFSWLKDHIPAQVSDSIAATASQSLNKALNVRLNYQIGKTALGIVYENVDPTYQTLGAMYFNNDLENIGFTFARPFFGDRLTVASQIGYQRDNLKEQKNQTSVRLVGNVNATFKASEQLTFSGSYSNFSTTTNRRLNQFDYINHPNMNPADTLSYRQLSQMGNLNANYIFGKENNQNINLNYSIAGQANEQGGIIRKGQANTVQNVNLSHSIAFPIAITLNTSVNYTRNDAGALHSNIYGSSVAIAKKFFEDKLSSSLGGLYNQTEDNNKNNRVWGIKCNAGYTLLEKHNFSLYAVQMWRDTSQGNNRDLTLNFNYSYNF